MALKLLEDYLIILERDGFAGLGERGFRFSSRNGRRLTCLCFHSVCFSWGGPYRSRCTAEPALWSGQGLARSVGVPQGGDGHLGCESERWWIALYRSTHSRPVTSAARVQEHHRPEQEVGRKEEMKEKRSNVKA